MRSLALNPDKSAFEFSIATVVEKGEKRLAYALLEFVRTDMQTIKPAKEVDYGQLYMKRSTLSLEEGTKLLVELYESKPLSLADLAPFAPFSLQSQPASFVPSDSQYGTYIRPWPMHISEWIVDNKIRGNVIQSVLAKAKLPLYPSSSEAIRGFFTLGAGRYWTFSEYGKLGIIVPDYRARIGPIKISYKQVSMTTVIGDIKPTDLRFKVYADDSTQSETSDDLELKEGSAQFSTSFDPGRIVLVLLDAKDESMIDMRTWQPGYANAGNVSVERPEQQIRDLVAAGEGKRIEFKGNIDNRDDFIETVVAFSNSEGGLILVGINDNRVPRGFKGDRDAILKTVRDSCEPLVEPTFKEYELDGYPILSIEIPSGQDKPYLVKNKGTIYIRIGPNDVPVTRLDLDQLMQAKGGGVNSPWNSVV